MGLRNTRSDLLTRQDGFGSRRAEDDDNLGSIEVLTLRPVLGTPSAEHSIRTRSERLAEIAAGLVTPVHDVRRAAGSLQVVSAAVDGVPVSAVLNALASGRLKLADEAVLDVAASIVTAVAALHERLPGFGHGAIVPAHVVLMRDGRAMLTGASFGSALEAMQVNREHHWREFGVALPPAASWPRFDQRSDVTQLGALILALLIRRPLLVDDYPRGVADIVAGAGPKGSAGSGIRTWLQQALQVHSRSIFDTAGQAEGPLMDAVPAAIGRRASLASIQTMVRLMCGDGPKREPARVPVLTAALSKLQTT